MSQRRTVPRRLPQGGGLDSVGFSPLGKDPTRIRSLCRQWLACISATLTMCIVGSIYGWPTSSLLHLTSGTGGVPLTLSSDEYSWIVSLTVLGSMIGSLEGAHLADRSGRKYGLLICSAMFTAGWIIIYSTASVRALYFARVIHGIGVGIAQTINPMYVSEVADIKFRGAVCALIAVNVYTGSLLTCGLGSWLTYKSLLLVLISASFTSFLSNMLFPETPYFLAAKSRKKQACKSIAYYKGIVDPHKVQIELRNLRSQTKYELHPQLRYEEHQQSRSDSLSPPRSDLSPQSIREEIADAIRQVDTEPMPDLHLLSITDSLSTPVKQSEVICKEQQQPTGKLRALSTSEVHPDSTSESQSQSRSDSRRHSRSDSGKQHRSDSRRHSKSDSDTQSRSDSGRHSRSDSGTQPTSDLRRQSNVDSRASIDMDEIHMDGTKYTWLTKLQVILQRSNRKALFIMLGLIMAQQLSGNFVTMQYLEILFDKTLVIIDPYEATILVQFVNLVSGTITIFTVEYAGRRKLLILSTLGSCFTLSIIATYFLLAEHMFDVSIFSVFPIIDLLVYQATFQIGLGTLPNVLLCELFPTELKGFVGAIIVIFNGIIGFTVSKLYQLIIDNIGSSGVYFIFATSCCLAYVLVFQWIPETKGKTYKEIEALLAGKNLNSSNEYVRSDRRNIHRL